MAPICVPPVTAPRVPASIIPCSACFFFWLSRAVQKRWTAAANRESLATRHSVSNQPSYNVLLLFDHKGDAEGKSRETLPR